MISKDALMHHNECGTCLIINIFESWGNMKEIPQGNLCEYRYFISTRRSDTL